MEEQHKFYINQGPTTEPITAPARPRDRAERLRATLGHHERPHRMLRGGAMRRQLEPLFEKRLQHPGCVFFCRSLRHLGHAVRWPVELRLHHKYTQSAGKM